MKIYNQGELVRDTSGRFSSFKASIKKFFKKVIRWSIIGFAVYVVFMAGAFFYSTSTVTAITSVVEAEAPIMDRIADCESGNGKLGTGSQIGKSGQVVIAINTNGTYDIGKYQINSIHNVEATKLGFNLMTEEGNYSYAKWLYANKGTGDWSSSAKCWQK